MESALRDRIYMQMQHIQSLEAEIQVLLMRIRALERYNKKLRGENNAKGDM